MRGWDDPELTVTDLLRFLSNRNYKLTGDHHSIHDHSSIKFMREVVGADSWVLDILRQGVKLDWAASPPENYSEQNNRSALKDMEFLTEKILEWEKAGFVSQTSVKPAFVNWSSNLI